MWCYRKSRDWKYVLRMRNQSRAFFLTIVVVQNVVTFGLAHAQPEVAQYPP